MPGQWEFQVGPLAPLEVADHLWVARWLLHRTAEDFKVSATLNPKPVKGDWNGVGAHATFPPRLCARCSPTPAAPRWRRPAKSDRRQRGSRALPHPGSHGVSTADPDTDLGGCSSACYGAVVSRVEGLAT